MTPKEKAIELVDKFYQTTPNEAWINEPLGIAKEYKAYNQSKQCALIAVDEMIIQNGELYLNGLDGIYYREKNSYLFEVKQEIEAL